MRLGKPVRGRRPYGRRSCGQLTRTRSRIPYRKNKPVRSLKPNNPDPIKTLATALCFISTGTCPTTTLRGNPRKKSDVNAITSRPPQPQQPSDVTPSCGPQHTIVKPELQNASPSGPSDSQPPDDPSSCGPQHTIVKPELQNACPSEPSDSQPPDDAKTILENVFDLAIQRAEASGKDPKKIGMVRNIRKFYFGTLNSDKPLHSPEKLLHILRSNSRNRKFKIKKNLSFIVDAWIKCDVKSSSMNRFDKFQIMSCKDLIVTKLANKLIDAYDAFIDTKNQPSTQADYIQQPLPTPTSNSTFEYSKLKTPLNPSPKKTPPPPKEKNPKAPAPSPTKPPLLEIPSSTISPTGIFETLDKISNHTQNGLHNVTKLFDGFAPIQISTALPYRIIQIPGLQTIVGG